MASPEKAPGPKKAADLTPLPVSVVARAAEGGLSEVVPGFALVDRDLDLSGGLVADLVGVDPAGRLVLVLFARDRDQELSVAALEALRFARQHAGLLARHLEARTLRTELAPRVFLVGESFEPALAARLAPLLGEWIELFEVRTLRSARGERAYLERVAPGAPGGPAGGVDLFLAAGPEDQRELARLALRRLERVDEGIEPAATRDHVLWRSGDGVLARLSWGGGRLRGAVPRRAAELVLRDAADVDGFLEEVLASHVELLREDPPLAEDDLGGPGLGGGELERPLDVVLTPEELEAFRE